MAKKPLPSPEVLRQLLRCDPETGKLFWKERGLEWFSSGGHSAEHTRSAWNTRYANREAFTAMGGTGYRQGAVTGRPLQAHRVVWAMVYGRWPHEIDHINGVRDDNRLANLREVSRQENSRNRRLHGRNTSEACGVYWHTRDRKWFAAIGVDGRLKHLGVFATRKDAVDAREAAEARFGFHENHGR